jgi:hypothetical protein
LEGEATSNDAAVGGGGARSALFFLMKLKRRVRAARPKPISNNRLVLNHISKKSKAF